MSSKKLRDLSKALNFFHLTWIDKFVAQRSNGIVPHQSDSRPQIDSDLPVIKASTYLAQNHRNVFRNANGAIRPAHLSIFINNSSQAHSVH